jgi:hypothetical protein
LGVLTVAENTSELLQNLPVLRFGFHASLVRLGSILEQAFSFKEVADFLQNQAVLDAELSGAVECKASLL